MQVLMTALERRSTATKMLLVFAMSVLTAIVIGISDFVALQSLSGDLQQLYDAHWMAVASAKNAQIDGLRMSLELRQALIAPDMTSRAKAIQGIAASHLSREKAVAGLKLRPLVPEDSARLAVFESESAIYRSNINQAPPLVARPAAPLSAATAAALAQLRQLLADSDAQAIECVDDLLEQAQGTALAATLQAVVAALERFDFDAALQALLQGHAGGLP